MKNSIITTITAISLTFVSAMAKAETTQQTVSQYIAPICKLHKENRISLSKNAIKVCNNDAKKMPTFTKNGLRLKKSRSGGEFNTLIANINFIK